MSKIVHHRENLGDVQLHYVTAGEGEPVVLLHGWPQTWYEWRYVIPLLADRYHVVAPDLRGLGDSSCPSSGYDKRTVAEDIWRLIHDVLGYKRWCLVGHDWGGPVAYALAAAHQYAVRRLVIIESPPRYEGLDRRSAWHVPFHQVPELPELLVQGREELYLGWFYRNMGHPTYVMPEEAVTEYLRTYTRPEALHAGFEYYRAIPQDTADNTTLARAPQKLSMPVLAVKSGGPWTAYPDRKISKNDVAEAMKPLANDVNDLLVDETGHWVPEEKPQLLANRLTEFFARP